MGDEDATALRHGAYAELSPEACYVRVHHGAGAAVADSPAPGCGYPADRDLVLGQLERGIAGYERVAAGQAVAAPMALACGLESEVLRHGAMNNGGTLRRLTTQLGRGRTYPYSAIATFGFGHGVMSDSALVDWRPGQDCPDLSKQEMNRLGVMSERAGYAAQAYWGRVAPVVIVSGGAVHASLIEAHALSYLLSCRHSVPPDAILLDPCADHTHTSIRNAGGLVVELGGRTAYLVTDQGYQGGYLQEWNPFHFVGGSIDQRALRDWGYLLGAWRQASVGIDSGFWFTPYRFWAGPADGAGRFTCVR